MPFKEGDYFFHKDFGLFIVKRDKLYNDYFLTEVDLLGNEVDEYRTGLRGMIVLAQNAPIEAIEHLGFRNANELVKRNREFVKGV